MYEFGLRINLQNKEKSNIKTIEKFNEATR